MELTHKNVIFHYDISPCLESLNYDGYRYILSLILSHVSTNISLLLIEYLIAQRRTGRRPLFSMFEIGELQQSIDELRLYNLINQGDTLDTLITVDQIDVDFEHIKEGLNEVVTCILKSLYHRFYYAIDKQVGDCTVTDISLVDADVIYTNNITLLITVRIETTK